jgi:hypothetical protein
MLRNETHEWSSACSNRSFKASVKGVNERPPLWGNDFRKERGVATRAAPRDGDSKEEDNEEIQGEVGSNIVMWEAQDE